MALLLVVLVVPSDKVLEEYFLWRGEGAERCPSWVTVLSEIYIHTCLCTLFYVVNANIKYLFSFCFQLISIKIKHQIVIEVISQMSIKIYRTMSNKSLCHKYFRYKLFKNKY